MPDKTCQHFAQPRIKKGPSLCLPGLNIVDSLAASKKGEKRVEHKKSESNRFEPKKQGQLISLSTNRSIHAPTCARGSRTVVLQTVASSVKEATGSLGVSGPVVGAVLGVSKRPWTSQGIFRERRPGGSELSSNHITGEMKD